MTSCALIPEWTWEIMLRAGPIDTHQMKPSTTIARITRKTETLIKRFVPRPEPAGKKNLVEEQHQVIRQFTESRRQTPDINLRRNAGGQLSARQF